MSIARGASRELGPLGPKYSEQNASEFVSYFYKPIFFRKIVEKIEFRV